MKTGLVILILVCVAVFIVTSLVTFKVNKGRFERRNIAGIQEFSSYAMSVLIGCVEGLLMLLAKPAKWASVAFGLAALLMLWRSP